MRCFTANHGGAVHFCHSRCHRGCRYLSVKTIHQSRYLREICNCQKIAFAQNHGTENGVFKLAHIAWPVTRCEVLNGVIGETLVFDAELGRAPTGERRGRGVHPRQGRRGGRRRGAVLRLRLWVGRQLAEQGLDLVFGRNTERTELEMVRKKPVPFPPEPFRWTGVQLTRKAIQRADDNEGRRGPWLRFLDRFGIGFDS